MCNIKNCYLYVYSIQEKTQYVNKAFIDLIRQFYIIYAKWNVFYSNQSHKFPITDNKLSL